MEALTDGGPLWQLLHRESPTHLYHYTGPAGAIGILQSRKLWAGRPADMNDATEQLLAQEYAELELRRLNFPTNSFGEGMVEYALDMLRLRRPVLLSASRVYTVSLTSEGDSLEQWRAYCPRSGGVALGFQSEHLRLVAADQGYLLAPCVYDTETHLALVRQIVKHHLVLWNERRALELPREGISGHLVNNLIEDLERFAPLIKHGSFSAEHEWRLISPHSSETHDLQYRQIAGPSGIKVFLEFDLLTDAHPEMLAVAPEDSGAYRPDQQPFVPVIGPSLDFAGMHEAIRTLIPKEFGWVAVVGQTESPYR